MEDSISQRSDSAVAAAAAFPSSSLATESSIRHAIERRGRGQKVWEADLVYRCVDQDSSHVFFLFIFLPPFFLLYCEGGVCGGVTRLRSHCSSNRSNSDCFGLDALMRASCESCHSF